MQGVLFWDLSGMPNLKLLLLGCWIFLNLKASYTRMNAYLKYLLAEQLSATGSHSRRPRKTNHNPRSTGRLTGYSRRDKPVVPEA